MTVQQQLTHALHDMVMVSLRATPEEVEFGPPCSYLIESCIRAGVDTVAKDILSNRQSEFRLNGAGLKLISNLYGTPENPRLTLSVGGDQAHHYPSTLPKLRQIVQNAGLAG